jgi:hypothetical protein
LDYFKFCGDFASSAILSGFRQSSLWSRRRQRAAGSGLIKVRHSRRALGGAFVAEGVVRLSEGAGASEQVSVLQVFGGGAEPSTRLEASLRGFFQAQGLIIAYTGKCIETAAATQSTT